MESYCPVHISNVNIRPYNHPYGAQLRAFCDVTLNNTFTITGIKLLTGKKGLYLRYPRRRNRYDNERFFQIFTPLSKGFALAISDIVIKRYLQMIIVAGLEC